MDATERKVLKTISETLISASKTTWSQGDIHKYALWGVRMEQAITIANEVINTLISENDTVSDEKLDTLNDDVKQRIDIWKASIPFKCPHGEFSCDYVDTASSSLMQSCGDCPKNNLAN